MPLTHAHLGAHGPAPATKPRHLLLGELLDGEDVLPDKGVQQWGCLEVGHALGGCLAWDGARWVEVAVLDHSQICSTKRSRSAHGGSHTEPQHTQALWIHGALTCLCHFPASLLTGVLG